MKFVVCLDKFRGSATADEACAAVAAGIRDAQPDADIRTIPIADGGEGTIDALVRSGYARHTATVTGPLGSPVRADFAVQGLRAVIEMAQASGRQLARGRPRPLEASTLGTGELVVAALDLGCRTIVLTAGGSATTDGGAGMLQALGARLHTADGTEIGPGGGALAFVAHAGLAGLDSRLTSTEFILASDVSNPLLGPAGAARTFAAQKGASRAEIERLEAGLTRYAEVLATASGVDDRQQPGAGAAGGLGFAALSVLRARPVAGIDFLIDSTGVDAALEGATWAVVGEGRLDEQSLQGKAPVGVAARAQRRGVAVLAVAGQVLLSADQLRAVGIADSYSLVERAGNRRSAMRDTAALLAAVGRDIAGRGHAPRSE